MSKRIDQLRGVELFKRFVELHGKAGEKQDMLYEAGLDATNFADDYHAMIRCMMCLAFTAPQLDWIDWWLYERVEKVVTFTDGRPPVRLKTAEELWAFIHEREDAGGGGGDGKVSKGRAMPQGRPGLLQGSLSLPSLKGDRLRRLPYPYRGVQPAIGTVRPHLGKQDGLAALGLQPRRFATLRLRSRYFPLAARFLAGASLQNTLRSGGFLPHPLKRAVHPSKRRPKKATLLG